MSADDVRLVGIEQVPPYPVMSPGDLDKLPPVKFLVEGLIPEQSIVGITSYPGLGKTWLAFEVTRALATRTALLGKFDINAASPVLFVGSDASIYDYAQQWRKLTHGIEDEQWAATRAHARFLLQSDFLFESLDATRKMVRTVRDFRWGPVTEEIDEDGAVVTSQATGFKLVVFDTLSKLTRANQNDNSAMEEVFRNIRLITEAAGASVLLLHHNSKRTEFNSGDDWRGAMAQIGALDCWFDLKKPTGKSQRGIVKVECKKFRGLTPDPFRYRMDVMDPEHARLTIFEGEPEVEAVATPEPVDVTPKTVPELIREQLSRGSKLSNELQELAILLFNDLDEADVRNRVKSALSTGKKAGEFLYDRKSKHYMLAAQIVKG